MGKNDNFVELRGILWSFLALPGAICYLEFCVILWCGGTPFYVCARGKAHLHKNGGNWFQKPPFCQKACFWIYPMQVEIDSFLLQFGGVVTIKLF